MSASDVHATERDGHSIEDPTEGVDLLDLLTQDGQPLGSVAEIALAIREGTVTFSMLMKALYYQYPQWSRSASDERREKYRALYLGALPQFVRRHGGIDDSYFANEFGAGVVLTGKVELFCAIWWDELRFNTNPARALEADINDLRLKAELYLSLNHRRICMQRLIRIYKALISSLRIEYQRWEGADIGEAPMPHAGHVADLTELRAELDGVRVTYCMVGSARGQARYIAGAALGAAVIVATAGVIAAVAADSDQTVWLGSIAAGAIGALLSVLERLTRRSLDIRFESDRILLGGVSRPVVGAISGIALFALVDSGIVPLDVPASAAARGLFFAAVAFLGGFSERFAKDVFGNAAGAVGGKTDQSDSTPAS
jgi:hypothetical protein